MSEDPAFPPIHAFPEQDGLTNNCQLPRVTDATGLMVAQDGDDFFRVQINLFLGPTPNDGAVCFNLNAEGAREVAMHLLHLADYAEIGVESQRAQ